MEELVEKFASKLMPSFPVTVYDALTELKQLRAQGAESQFARDRYLRLLQELLAYKRGAFVEDILQKVLNLTNRSQLYVDGEHMHRKLGMHALPVLVALSESQVVARFCVQDEGRARKLARILMDTYGGFIALFEDGQQTETVDIRGLHLALQMVDGFVYFSRVSRSFRLMVRELDDLFAALEHLLSDKIVGLPSLPVDLVTRAVDCTLLLTYALTISEEGQQWAIDQGLIRIHAAIARLSPREDINEKLSHNSQLLKELYPRIGPELAKKHYAALERKLLETDRQIRDPHCDGRRVTELRAEFVKVVKAEMRWGDDLRNLPSRPLAARVTGCSETPVVCSWSLCVAGPLETAGKLFSKCANCSLAFYCSKDHQTMHWKTHKKQCKEAQS